MSLLLTQLAGGAHPWTRWADDPAADPRPRLVFVGEALDHWSSALAASLQGDGALRAALAEVFVCLAVDAAAEPEIAARMQHALQITAGTGGWPLLAVCTPAREPFGATPWRRAHDLAHLLLQAAEAWHRRPGDCLADAERLAASVRALHSAPAAGAKPLRPVLLLDAAEAAAMELADTLEGGFGPPPRTAEPALWGFLIARAARSAAPLSLSRQVELSLAALVAGAAHDHLAGGFFQGCDDAAWRQPRCAKRLTDQAQIAMLLLDAAEVLRRPLWREVALRALAFAAGSLRRADGSFAHGLHADSPSAPGRWEDGAAYRWSTAQMAAIIGEEGAQLVAQRFGLPADPDEAGHLAVGAALATAQQARLPALIQRLQVARSERPQPRRDEAVYAIEQAQIACALERADLVELADGVRPHLSGDHPWTGRALAARWRRTGTPEPRAVEIAERERADEIDPAGGLSTAAVLAHLRLDLAELTGDGQWRIRAQAQVEQARERLRTAPLACAGMMGVVERMWGGGSGG